MIERVSTKTPFREGRKCCERPTDVVCRSSLVSGQAEQISRLERSSPLSDTKVFAFGKNQGGTTERCASSSLWDGGVF